jgi:hypothetical protein
MTVKRNALDFRPCIREVFRMFFLHEPDQLFAHVTSEVPMIHASCPWSKRLQRWPPPPGTGPRPSTLKPWAAAEWIMMIHLMNRQRPHSIVMTAKAAVGASGAIRGDRCFGRFRNCLPDRTNREKSLPPSTSERAR